MSLYFVYQISTEHGEKAKQQVAQAAKAQLATPF
jgi:hypothetical protein